MRYLVHTAIVHSLLVALASTALPALAQDTTEARRSAANRYLSVVPMSKMLADMTSEMAKTVAPDKREEFVRHMQKALRVESLERIATDAMVATFTAGELDALADFYGSATGRSAMNKFGAYMAIVMPAIQEEVRRALGQ